MIDEKFKKFITVEKINFKDFKVNSKENIDSIGRFYYELAKTKDGIINRAHKNYFISVGVDCARIILIIQTNKILRKCVKHKTLKYSNLRQYPDLEKNRYFWVGMKLINNLV